MSFSTYVQRADQPKVYLTASSFRTGVDKQAKDLRDKTIVEFNDDDITALALRGDGGAAVQLAKKNGEWWIEQPASVPRRQQRGARAAVDDPQPARHRLRQRQPRPTPISPPTASTPPQRELAPAAPAPTRRSRSRSARRPTRACT